MHLQVLSSPPLDLIEQPVILTNQSNLSLICLSPHLDSAGVPNSKYTRVNDISLGNYCDSVFFRPQYKDKSF